MEVVEALVRRVLPCVILSTLVLTLMQTKRQLYAGPPPAATPTFRIVLPQGLHSTDASTPRQHAARDTETRIVELSTDRNLQPVILVWVPDADPTTDAAAQTTQARTCMPTTIPPALFHDPHIGATSMRLALTWNAPQRTISRHRSPDYLKAADDLARGIENLRLQCKRRGVQPCFILIGDRQGGNIINAAGNAQDAQGKFILQDPVDLVIQLATPIVCYDPEGKPKECARYTPHARLCKTLILLHSTPDKMPAHTTCIYRPQEGIPLYNILLSVRGQPAEPTTYASRLVGTELLSLCAQILTSYKLHRNLQADITPNAADSALHIFIAPWTEAPAVGWSDWTSWKTWKAGQQTLSPASDTMLKKQFELEQTVSKRQVTAYQKAHPHRGSKRRKQAV